MPACRERVGTTPKGWLPERPFPAGCSADLLLRGARARTAVQYCLPCSISSANSRLLAWITAMSERGQPVLVPAGSALFRLIYGS